MRCYSDKMPMVCSPLTVALDYKLLIRQGADIFSEVCREPSHQHQTLTARLGVSLRLLLSSYTEQSQRKWKLVSPGSIKDGAGSLSRQRHNEILAVLSQPPRVSSTKRPGPAAGQTAPCDLWSSLSGIISIHTISWRHAIRVQLRVSTDPHRHSCLLTTAWAKAGFLLLMGGNGGFTRCSGGLLCCLTRTALTSSLQSIGSVFSTRILLPPLRILVVL